MFIVGLTVSVATHPLPQMVLSHYPHIRQPVGLRMVIIVISDATHRLPQGDGLRYSVLVTFDSDLGLSASKPFASAKSAANNCAGII